MFANNMQGVLDDVELRAEQDRIRITELEERLKESVLATEVDRRVKDVEARHKIKIDQALKKYDALAKEIEALKDGKCILRHKITQRKKQFESWKEKAVQQKKEMDMRVSEGTEALSLLVSTIESCTRGFVGKSLRVLLFISSILCPWILCLPI